MGWADDKRLFTQAGHGPVSYDAWWEPAETFRVNAYEDSMSMDSEATVAVQIMPDELRLEVDGAQKRLVLVIVGEHPKDGAWIIDRVFFDLETGKELGREGARR